MNSSLDIVCTMDRCEIKDHSEMEARKFAAWTVSVAEQLEQRKKKIKNPGLRKEKKINRKFLQVPRRKSKQIDTWEKKTSTLMTQSARNILMIIINNGNFEIFVYGGRRA